MQRLARGLLLQHHLSHRKMAAGDHAGHLAQRVVGHAKKKRITFQLGQDGHPPQPSVRTAWENGKWVAI
ncbi:hypothetical protein GCM10010840_08340 [Deinococcus aerolatus]|uniref:Uncharacterized protein n=1 Tax=Deinococcus aerolatus TaxID=522487 RepID=A0ABQ2G3B1_9DEIO|nr:hypothetical protein GCM10010840_08340 [Deinococcus aerolatus]